MGQTTLYLFAHQDDEIGVLAEISREIAGGGRAVCAYLTDGAVGAVTSAQRNAESSAVLRKTGVPAADIHFLGEACGIGDGVLIRRLDPAFEALHALIARAGRPDRIVSHGWEGGHQDHDAVHLLGVVLAVQLGILTQSRQFPLYRTPLLGPLPYTVLRPLPANGPVERRPMTIGTRLRHLRHCLTYKSQRKTFAGLLPFILADYLLVGSQTLQPLSIERLREPPHAGILLYEKWGRCSWSAFRAEADAFLARHLGPPASIGAVP